MLLDARELSLQDPEVVRRAVTRLVGEVGFSDALISELGQASGCEYTVTFDRKAARLQDMQLVPDRRRRR